MTSRGPRSASIALSSISVVVARANPLQRLHCPNVVCCGRRGPERKRRRTSDRDVDGCPLVVADRPGRVSQLKQCCREAEPSLCDLSSSKDPLERVPRSRPVASSERFEALPNWAWHFIAHAVHGFIHQTELPNPARRNLTEHARRVRAILVGLHVRAVWWTHVTSNMNPAAVFEGAGFAWT